MHVNIVVNKKYDVPLISVRITVHHKKIYLKKLKDFNY